METESPVKDARLRLQAAVLSLIVGAALLGVKFFAYSITGSTAVLSDAMESIVNVAAALFALGGIVFAGRPADRSHPYGHGKIEFFSAAFEGGLIAFAALLIVYQAVQGFVRQPEIRQLDAGLGITFGAGVVNAALGWFLVSAGRKAHSLTLVADGQHVLSDFWTSLGVVVGLGLVKVTGLVWFDPLVATLVAVNLAWTGVKLVRHAAGGLLDEVDAGLLRRILRVIEANAGEGIIRLHHLRAIRAGRFHHVDAHLVVPEFWPVERAHDLVEKFEQIVIGKLRVEGEIVFHTDPCRRSYCEVCDLPDCPIRVAQFVARAPLSVEEVVRTDKEVMAGP